MRFDILTLFPGLFDSPLSESLLKKARDRGIIDVNLHNIRDYAGGSHRVTDDTPFGGGGGMVMKVEPVARALDEIDVVDGPSITILLSPQGTPFTQKRAEELARYARIVLVCGRYEGVDERIRRHLIDAEISIGDFVLSGGELPALIVIDAVSRLVPGYVGNSGSVEKDSFTTGLLEGPHYTRPREFRGWTVPEVLLSGHEKKIAEWRHRESLRRTLTRRPDLLERASLSDDDRAVLRVIMAEETEHTA